MKYNEIILGDALDVMRGMPDACVDCIITSPPYYGLRDYGVAGQIGNENNPAEYIDRLIFIFNEARRMLKDSGTLWVIIGDSYSGSGKGHGSMNALVASRPTKATRSNLPPKSLIGIPWRFALAMQERGWILRQDIIWNKPDVMPESVKDRFTKSHEYIFLFAKTGRYYFNQNAVKEPALCAKTDARMGYGRLHYCGKREGAPGTGQENFAYVSEYRNKRSVWNVSNKGFDGEHFAVFPEKLIIPCIKAGCPENGIVLDPFIGSGTTALTAIKLDRRFIGIEINPEYHKLASSRAADEMNNLFDYKKQKDEL
jgi:DNA modification methylase